MLEQLLPYIVAAFSLVFVVLLLVLLVRRRSIDGARAAGREGELACLEIVQRHALDDDLIFSNVELQYEDKHTELDCLVVNLRGIFIIEAKNYSGNLVGAADDFEWDKYHTTEAGNVYVKKVKNPLKQMERQVYILSHILHQKDIHVWIEGYAFLAQGQSPVRDKRILRNERDVVRAIHPRTKPVLSNQKIRRIQKMFEKYEE